MKQLIEYYFLKKKIKLQLQKRNNESVTRAFKELQL